MTRIQQRDSPQIPFYLSTSFIALIIAVANVVMLKWVGWMPWWGQGLASGGLAAALGGAWLLLVFALTRHWWRRDVVTIVLLVSVVIVVIAARAWLSF